MTPINVATNAAGPPITGGGLNDPQGIAITPNGQTAYVVNVGGNSVTPINLATDTAGTPITGGGMNEPTAIAITPNGRTAYVTNGALGDTGVTPINLPHGHRRHRDHRRRAVRA